MNSNGHPEVENAIIYPTPHQPSPILDASIADANSLPTLIEVSHAAQPPVLTVEVMAERGPEGLGYELSLDDIFVKGDLPVPAATGMPAVLVDQLLIDEIQSIPDRFGFKIGDVADLLGIKQYILRYWEQEFEVLKPKKASNNQRLYTKKDVENAFLIKKLLYRDRFSIEGARQAMKDVKFALKKEKDYSMALQKNDEKNSDLHHHLIQLVSDIKRIQKIFI